MDQYPLNTTPYLWNIIKYKTTEFLKDPNASFERASLAADELAEESSVANIIRIPAQLLMGAAKRLINIPLSIPLFVETYLERVKRDFGLAGKSHNILIFVFAPPYEAGILLFYEPLHDLALEAYSIGQQTKECGKIPWMRVGELLTGAFLYGKGVSGAVTRIARLSTVGPNIIARMIQESVNPSLLLVGGGLVSGSLIPSIVSKTEGISGGLSFMTAKGRSRGNIEKKPSPEEKVRQEQLKETQNQIDILEKKLKEIIEQQETTRAKAIREINEQTESLQEEVNQKIRLAKSGKEVIEIQKERNIQLKKLRRKLAVASQKVELPEETDLNKTLSQLKLKREKLFYTKENLASSGPIQDNSTIPRRTLNVNSNNREIPVVAQYRLPPPSSVPRNQTRFKPGSYEPRTADPTSIPSKETGGFFIPGRGKLPTK